MTESITASGSTGIGSSCRVPCWISAAVSRSAVMLSSIRACRVTDDMSR